MIQATLRIVVNREKRGAALELMESLIGPMHLVPGCIGCRLYQDLEDENGLAIVQEFESETALHNFIRSNEYPKILTLMDLSSDPPEVLFDQISETEGIELVEDLRTRNG